MITTISGKTKTGHRVSLSLYCHAGLDPASKEYDCFLSIVAGCDPLPPKLEQVCHLFRKGLEKIVILTRTSKEFEGRNCIKRSFPCFLCCLPQDDLVD